MVNNSLDEIVKCNIVISHEAEPEDAFGRLLIVVAPPAAAGEKSTATTFSITSADDLLDYGYTTSNQAYIAADVVFSQNPAPKDISVVVRTITSEAGVTPVVYETIDKTLDRAKTEATFYGIHLTEFKVAADILAASTWADKNEKLFGFEYVDIAQFPLTDVQAKATVRTFALYSGSADGYAADAQPAKNAYAALAWLTTCLALVPGSETWAYKELVDIVPSLLTDSNKEDLEEKFINTYRRYANKNVTFGGYCLCGEWIDVIRVRDWLKSEIQNNVFRAISVNTKIPFTDNGISLIESQIETALRQGQINGGIDTTAYDAEGNELPGYTITVPKASDFTPNEKATRRLTGLYWTARLTGAIHLVEIEGSLTF